MTLDAEQAALLVRVTARISAGLLAASLLVSTWRINEGDYRLADVRLFIGFIVSHTIHFICVGLLAVATNGANIESRFGYGPVMFLGILFYIGCAAILRAKRRSGDRWTTRNQRNTEIWPLVAVWGGFAQAYVLRLHHSLLFAVLAIALVCSIVWFLIRALKSEVVQSWQTSSR